MFKYDPRLKQRARYLRRAQTDSERCLWQRLRRRQICGVHFYRQRPLGEYIVDFYAPAAKLVVEVDGTRHTAPAAAEYDEIRTAFLQAQRLAVLRFSNADVLQQTDQVVAAIEGVVRRALNVLSHRKVDREPALPPLQKGDRGGFV
jgi:very-short-patch-repair endonuclease